MSKSQIQQNHLQRIKSDVNELEQYLEDRNRHTNFNDDQNQHQSEQIRYKSLDKITSN